MGVRADEPGRRPVGPSAGVRPGVVGGRGRAGAGAVRCRRPVRGTPGGANRPRPRQGAAGAAGRHRCRTDPGSAGPLPRRLRADAGERQRPRAGTDSAGRRARRRRGRPHLRDRFGDRTGRGPAGRGAGGPARQPSCRSHPRRDRRAAVRPVRLAPTDPPGAVPRPRPHLHRPARRGHRGAGRTGHRQWGTGDRRPPRLGVLGRGRVDAVRAVPPRRIRRPPPSTARTGRVR